MTIRNLEFLFNPRSVALIGASERPDSLGTFLANNLFGAGFKGEIALVNPKYQQLGGRPVYRDVTALPSTPELAVIATPPLTVPHIVSQLGARGTKAAVIISAGFGEAGRDSDRDLRQEILDAAKPHLLRIVGPNCLGIMVPAIGLNASFAQLHPKAGGVAFVAQSGAIVTAMLDWAASRGIGFSHLVSLGNMSDVDFGDMLDYLASDPHCKTLLLYIESISHARKFMSAARAAARSKAVIVVKAGRHAEGARAATSHTGALAGSDAVFDAVFRRTGLLRVYSLQELFDASATLANARIPAKETLVILTNGGGLGVLAADYLAEIGGRLTTLSAATLARLDAVLPATWSRANPIDLIGDAGPERYAAALQILAQVPEAEAVLVIHCPTALCPGLDAARAVSKARMPGNMQVLTTWVGDPSAAPARRWFTEQGIPTYETPEQAIRAFMQALNYHRAQDNLLQTPPSIPEAFKADPQRARAIVTQALQAGRAWLSSRQTQALLEAYAIPLVVSEEVATPELAAALGAKLAQPIALKIRSPDIQHKSEAGGVALNLSGAQTIAAAAREMLARVEQARPEARIEGFCVEPMISRAHAFELIVGAASDAQFGPVLLFGQGGTAVEIIADKALGLPPLNMKLAHEMMARTRVYALLQGYRDRPPAALDAIALTLIKVSQLVSDIAEIEELDINPLLADAQGVIALDARVKVSATTRTPVERLAIRPYPKELEQKVRLEDGRALLLRPIVPEDEPAVHAGFAKLTPEQIYFRFFTPLRKLSHETAARFTQRDYDREMTLVATDPGIPGTTELYGAASIVADPDNQRAEFSVTVRHDMTGKGLGLLLLQQIIQYARQRGLAEIFGQVLCENIRMLNLCRTLGFRLQRLPENPHEYRVSLDLRQPTPDPL